VGVLAAVKQYSVLDYVATGVAFIGLSMPVFWFGLLAILLFGVQLGWLPTSGIGTIGLQGFDPLDRLRYLILPASVLALVFAGGYTRYVRASLLEVIHQDYVRTARSKGLTERAVVLGHAFRNALIPVVTLLALDLPDLFTGAVVTETIFAWPGVGRLAIESIQARDYPVVQAVVLLATGAFVVTSIVADLLYSVLDPRIRLA
jgi:peptide/nickel transport system permease protein